jgi:hypothetical protein
LFFLVLIGTQASALACTCSEQSVPDALEHADVVFAGTVKDVRMVDDAKDWEPRVIVDFDVARVWKGEVGQSFTLHTNLEHSSCRGMGNSLAKPGEVLLVYANSGAGAEWKGNAQGGARNAGSFTMRGDRRRVADRRLLNSVGDEDRVYTTDICTRTQRVRYAVEDFEQLGAFTDLASLPVMPDKALVESLRPVYNGLPSDCGSLTDAKRWSVQEPTPDIAAKLVAMLEQGPLYASVPLDRRPAYTHYWVTDAEMRLGFCRVSQEPERVCGNTTMVFVRERGDSWRYGEGRVSSYCPSR